MTLTSRQVWGGKLRPDAAAAGPPGGKGSGLPGVALQACPVQVCGCWGPEWQVRMGCVGCMVTPMQTRMGPCRPAPTSSPTGRRGHRSYHSRVVDTFFQQLRQKCHIVVTALPWALQSEKLKGRQQMP